MSTLIIRAEDLSTVLKEHIDNNNLRPMILISEMINMPPENIDVFTLGIYPSQDLIGILAQVLEKLMQEREDYLAGREAT